MSTITKDLGVVTAYGYYKAGGGTMTESEFTQFMVDFGTASQTATEAAQAAAESAQASAARSADAQDSAEEASQSASTASAKATEATTAAGTAIDAKNDAVTAQTAAETAQGKAEDAQAAAAQSASEAAESARTLTIDRTLTQAGQAADSKAVGDEIDELKEDLNVNILLPITWTNGYYLNQNGTPVTHSDYQYSDLIVFNDELLFDYNVTVKARSGMYAILYNGVEGRLDQIIGRVDGSTSTAEIITFSISDYPGVKSVRLTNQIAYTNANVIASKIYDGKIGKVEYTNVENVNVTKEQSGYINKNFGTNLFNKDATGIKDGYYIANDGREATASYCEISDYTEVIPSKKYSHRCESYMGDKSQQFNYYDENKNFIGTEKGANVNNVVTVTTPSNCKYIKFNVRNSTAGTFMLVEGETIPAEYSAYIPTFYDLDDSVITEKLLYKKTAIFDGDSICHGTAVGASDPTYGYGWAGRIGIKNHMIWKNYGITGGTITDIDGHYCIGENIDVIHAAYPELDYLILEGGTNDADVIQEDTSRIGTISETDYSGSYNIDTFCGSVETWFYKAINYYPMAKIGFIIAQKMGVSNIGYGENNRRYHYFTILMEACKKWGIPFINLWDDSPLNPLIPSMYAQSKTAQQNIDAGNLYTDGQHLTSNGYDAITPKIEAWMKTL